MNLGNTFSAQLTTLSINDCNRLLQFNNHNRRIRQSTVKKYAEQMKRGKWEVNGEPIIVADNGDLMDGQHRLIAAIQADTPLTTLVVYGVKRSAFDTIDTGAGRNASDVLEIKGLNAETARIAAAAAKRCILFEKLGHTTQNKGNLHLTTPKECSDYVLRKENLVEIVELIQAYGRNGRILAAGGSAFLWLYMNEKNADGTLEFFDGLFTGANLFKNDPRLVFRQKIESFRFSQRKWNLETRIRGAVRAWDWFVRGKECPYPNNMLRDFETAYDLLK
jgi:hypothetical protein